MVTKTFDRNTFFQAVDQEQLALDRQRTNYAKLVTGKNRIRIIPHDPFNKYGRKVPFIKVWTHFGVGPNNSSIVCKIRTKIGGEPVGKTCPVCRYASRLTDEEEKKALAPSGRFRMGVWMYDFASKGGQIWETGPKVKGSLDVIDETWGFVDFNEGRDIFITKTGEGLFTQYNTYLSDRCPAPDALADWLSENGIPDLEATIVIQSDKEIEALMSGGFEDAEDDDDDDRTTAYDTDDDEEEETEEDEEEAPADARPLFNRNGRRPASAAGGNRRFSRN